MRLHFLAGLILPLAGYVTQACGADSSDRPPAVDLSRPADASAPPPGRIDRWHDSLYLKVQDWAQALDHKFAKDGEAPEQTPPTPFRISTDGEVIQHSEGGTDFNARIDVDILLQLPNLEKRLKLFVTSDSVQEAPSLVGRDDGRVRAGLRLTQAQYFDFDIGARLDVPPVAFTSVRWQRQLEAGGWEIEPFAKVYLETKDGFGAATGITFDHWTNRWLLRSSSYANWVKDDAATEWTQTFLVAHAREILRFGRYGTIVRGNDLVRAYGVQALISGDRTSKVDEYELSVFAKMPTARNWLYWRVAPMVRWERDYGWHADPGIRAGVDILFWDVSSR